mgnify:CR=1 FL=1|tara:strand:+ start:88 stop:261 length:174 start_codon:yes stop_codon:yes gene_type:complete
MEIYKRFMVFEYDSYYPAGGLDDVNESFDDELKAILYAKSSKYDYAEIFDREKGIAL